MFLYSIRRTKLSMSTNFILILRSLMKINKHAILFQKWQWICCNPTDNCRNCNPALCFPYMTYRIIFVTSLSLHEQYDLKSPQVFWLVVSLVIYVVFVYCCLSFVVFFVIAFSLYLRPMSLNDSIVSFYN